MNKIKMGVIGTSKKVDEHRMPIHPDHFKRLPSELLQQLVFEKGYGEFFGLTDTQISSQTGGVATRHELLADLGTVIIPKPLAEDLEELRDGGIVWGWPHCTQQQNIAQTAIDKKLTLIAFEEMFVWGPDGHQGRHTFYKNNELAGYAAVQHALQLKGIDGHYGNQRKVLIFSFGAVSRGAIYALKARGFRDITICIQRPDHEVREEVLDCEYVRIKNGKEDEARIVVVEHDGTETPFIDLISEAEIIVNGIFQNTNEPINFIIKGEESNLKPGCLIIDVSCDEGMGFFFAKPTTFKEPMFKVGQVNYYAVDHTPTYLWESATRCISASVIVHLPVILKRRESWYKDETIKRAIDIDNGVIQKPAILSFQNRKSEYPHAHI